MLGVNYRYKVFVDPRNQDIYCGNGPCLERFRLQNNVVTFKENWKVFENGEVVTGVLDYPPILTDSSEPVKNRLLVNSNSILAVCDYTKKSIEASGHCPGRIITCKVLDSGEILVLTAQKLLHVYKHDGTDLGFVRQITLGTKSTLFYGVITGNSFSNLSIYTGNVMGSLEVFEPKDLSETVSFVDARLIIRDNVGMIFGIQLFKDKIYTISDDRSVRVFDQKTGNQLDACYGHETRPRSVLVVDNPDGEGEEIYSAAETVNKWRWNEKDELVLVDKHDPDIGRIYSMAMVGSVLLMASINGALYGLDVGKNLMKKYLVGGLGDDVVVRSFVKVGQSEYFVIDDARNLLFLKDGKRDCLIQGSYLRFETLTLSESGNLLSATSDRKIYLFNVKTRNFVTILTENVLGGVVFAGEDLIAVSKTGNAVTLKLEDGILTKVDWKLQMRHHLSCALKWQNHVVLGFARGSLAVCSMEEDYKELFYHKLCKSKRGEPVVDLKISKNKLYALTKDGKYSVFDLDDFPLLKFSETSPVFDTPAGFYINPHTGDEYIWGFRSVDFVLTRFNSSSPIVSFDCRGGNRRCQLWPVYSTSETGTQEKQLTGFKFEHIAKGVLTVIEFDLIRSQNIVGPFHRHTIFGLAAIRGTSKKLQLLTGGVDTEMHLYVLDDSGRPQRKWMTSCHVSSIHAIDSVVCRNGSTLVATVGGNSEVKIWKAGDEALTHLKDFTGAPKFRYVSAKLLEVADGRIFVFAAASIRQLHVFEVVQAEKKLVKLLDWQNLDYSTIVKVDAVVFGNFIKIYAGATSGMVYCLDFDPREDLEQLPVTQIKAADCGLSALAVVGGEPDKVVAGDESGQLSLLDSRNQKTVASISGVHFSTISDVCCGLNRGEWVIASVSTDLMFSLTKIVRNGAEAGCEWELELVTKCRINVGDAMAVIAVPAAGDAKEECTYLVGGQGFEMVYC